MSEERIIELEIKLAYQEELVDTLNSIVAKQQTQIDKLEETCKLLHDKINALAVAEPKKNPVHEIPPHY
ncbi:SlyX family protein [Methylomarinum vadi]|uniref:SlyX family protein n=1 Tax=Methylomarinum vadi TaxID=438855 RepID=UPI0004DF4BE8|nr:SlyX family protein [Methylomarinum vadi]